MLSRDSSQIELINGSAVFRALHSTRDYVVLDNLENNSNVRFTQTNQTVTTVNYTNWPPCNVVRPKLFHIRWILAVSVQKTRQNNTNRQGEFDTATNQPTQISLMSIMVNDDSGTNLISIIHHKYSNMPFPTLIWHWWLGNRKGIWLEKVVRFQLFWNTYFLHLTWSNFGKVGQLNTRKSCTRR